MSKPSDDQAKNELIEELTSILAQDRNLVVGTYEGKPILKPEAKELLDKIVGLFEKTLTQTKAYWHPITKLRISALRKMYLYVLATETNEIDVADCGLTYSERSSLTILRFHALIAKVKDEEGHQHRRKWLITSRGAKFLRNQVKIPAKVKTYNNTVVDYAEELVGIIDVLGEDPKMPPTLPFERATPTVADIKKVQAKLL